MKRWEWSHQHGVISHTRDALYRSPWTLRRLCRFPAPFLTPAHTLARSRPQPAEGCWLCTTHSAAKPSHAHMRKVYALEIDSTRQIFACARRLYYVFVITCYLLLATCCALPRRALAAPRPCRLPHVHGRAERGFAAAARLRTVLNALPGGTTDFSCTFFAVTLLGLGLGLGF